jgi:hypothetical protein
VAGKLELVQYHGDRRSAIVVEPKKPITVSGRQVPFCFIMIDDNSWNPGPCKPGQVREVLERAAREHRALEIELADTTVHFFAETAEVTASDVVRIYDSKPGRSVR